MHTMELCNYHGIKVQVECSEGEHISRTCRCTGSQSWCGGDWRSNWLCVTQYLGRCYGTLNGHLPWQLHWLFIIQLLNKDGAFVQYWLALALTTIPENSGKLDPSSKFVPGTNAPAAVALQVFTVGNIVGCTSIGNGSNQLQQFRVRVGTGTRQLQRILLYENPDHCNWAGFSTKARHFNLTPFALMKCLSSDRIVTWPICQLRSFTRAFTSHFQICNPTNIRGVTIKNPRILLNICAYFEATQQISVRSQIRMLEVKELITLYNLRTHHVMIWSELKNLIAVKAVGTMRLEPQSGSNLAKTPRLYVQSG